jgi:hypothetical protein
MLANTFATAMGLLLVGAPVLSSYADDEQTQTLHTNSYQDFAGSSCGATECVVQFAKTQHINTVVTAISCDYAVPIGGQTLYAQLHTTNAPEYRFNVQTFISGTYNGNWFVAVNAQVNLFVKQGDTPQFFILTTAPSGTLNCTITGYHS